MDWLWYRRNPLAWLLLPLSLLFGLLSSLRRLRYALVPVPGFRAPVIVVGNLNVGGTGKTPLVIWLLEYLRTRGYRPGVVSRGYGGKGGEEPLSVDADSDPRIVGDEAVLLAVRCGCPIRVHRQRAAAVVTLLAQTDCDIVVSDDGLQHYAMHRDLEILVVDSRRGFGNGLLLPAGPLRESPRRLKKADLVIALGGTFAGSHVMAYRQPEIYPLNGTQEPAPLADWQGVRVHAFAGIGNPQRFFDLLRAAGLKLREHRFADHHDYRREDLQFGEELPLLMTEKDAVKCRRFDLPRAWVVRIRVQPDQQFIAALERRLQELQHG